MNLGINCVRGVGATVPTLSLLAKWLHQVLTTTFHFCILLFNFVGVQILPLIIAVYVKHLCCVDLCCEN